MPLLRSSRRGGPPEEVQLTVVVSGRPEGAPAIPMGGRAAVSFDEMASTADGAGAGAGGAIRSASKRAQRAASKSPYKRSQQPKQQQAKPLPAIPHNPPPGPVTAGLSAALDELGLGPISSRTRNRISGFHVRTLGALPALPAHLASSSSTLSSTATASTYRGGAAVRQPRASRRLQPIDTAATRRVSAADLVHYPSLAGGTLVPPRESRAAERRARREASTTRISLDAGYLATGRMLSQQPVLRVR